ncbi:hypothetical protein JCM18237_01510 [Halorubrum luteum]
MPDHTSLRSTWGTGSHLYDRYTSNAATELASSETLQAAHEEWVQFVITHHGDVFEEVDVENPRERLFIETLYYDLVVDRFIEFAERSFGCRLVNREATANTDALSFEFGSLHESIIDTDRVDRTVAESIGARPLVEVDAAFLRRLHESVVSDGLRRQLGQYYTPRGVAELAVAELEVHDYGQETFLDPGCGSGVFLAACIEAKREALRDARSPDALVDAITKTVYGIDLNPVAVKSAKLQYLLTLGPLLDASDVDAVELPVFLADALELTGTHRLRFGGDELDRTVDHLVGNPPWITWGNLSESVRDAWRNTYATELDLLPHRGAERRLGHANDDVSVPFVWVCMHRYLAEEGDASFVLKRDVMTGPAGKLLRSQRVNGRPVAVRQIHDLNGLRPFGGDAAVNAAVYTFDADSEPAFPIAVDSWTNAGRTPDFSTIGAMRNTIAHETTGVIPVDEDDPSSAWIRKDARNRALGECEQEIRHGVKDDAKSVYSIDRAQLEELERDHIYPYLRSKHVVKYGLFGYDLHLVPIRKANEDNESELRRACPRTYDYLESNRRTLEDRSSTWLKQGTFYNVFGVGEYTWSEYKVVWCRLGFKPHFAVVSSVEDADLGEKTVVPGDHLMFVSTDSEHEAHFLCGLLNSAVYQAALRDIASGGKSSLSKAVVSRLSLPEYDGSAIATRLAERSMDAHDIVPRHTDVSKRTYNRTEIEAVTTIQAEIDELAERLLARGESQ